MIELLINDLKEIFNVIIYFSPMIAISISPLLIFLLIKKEKIEKLGIFGYVVGKLFGRK